MGLLELLATAWRGQPMLWGLYLRHCPGVEGWALLSHALPLSFRAGWLNWVPSLAMLSQLLAPPAVHAASVTAPIWALLHAVPPPARDPSVN